MPAAPEWLPSPDADTAASVIGSGLELLPDGSSAATAGAGLAGLSNPALLVLGAVAGPIANEKLVELSKKADIRLQQYVEETDGDEEAYLRKLASGISHFLPDGEELETAAVEAARGDPAELRELLDQHADEGWAEMENATDRILRGDFDDMEDELCEAFGTQNVDEAQALFMDFRDILESQRVHETFEQVLELDENLDDVAEELSDTRRQMREQFREVLHSELRDEGINYLSPAQFDTEITDKDAPWRAGFNLNHVREGFAVGRESEQNESNTVTDDLLQPLIAGEDRLVVGHAGSGKSTVCKSVACEWYDQENTGPVFYHRSGQGGTKFTSVGKLKSALRNCEKQPLVVVEDVLNPEAENIFQVINDIDREAASFLFDTRLSDLNRYEGPGTRETDIQGELTDEFNRLTSVPHRYPLPESISINEIKAVFEAFESKTGRDVDWPPETVQDEIQIDAEIGEMLHLSYYLPIEEKQTAGLRADVKNKYETITGEGTDNDHWTGISTCDKKIRKDVAVMIALLVASGIGNHPELTHSLAEKYESDDNQYGAIHSEIKKIREALQGWFVYASNDEDSRINWTTHERWATLYLQQLTAENTASDEKIIFQTDEPTNRFLDCVEALLALVTNESRRNRLNDTLEATGLLDSIDENEETFGAFITKVIATIGRRRPALIPLYEFGSDGGLEIPSNWSDDTRASLFIIIGSACYSGKKHKFAREYYVRSLEIGKELGDKRILANSLNNLGTIARSQSNYESAREYHEQTLEIAKELGDKRILANSLNNIGTVAGTQGDYESARQFFEQSLEIVEEFENRPKIANGLNNLGHVSQSQGDHESAREYYERSLEIAEELGERQILANSLNNLGTVAGTQGDYESARQFFERSLEIAKELGNRQILANSLNNLGNVTKSQDDYESAREYYERSLEIAKELGDKQGVADSLNNLGVVERAEDDHDSAIDYFKKSLKHRKQIRDLNGVVDSFNNIIRTHENLNENKATIEWCKRAKEWVEGIEQIDLSDKASEFELRRLKADVSEETTDTLYHCAIKHILDNENKTAADLFTEIWNRQTQFSDDNDVFNLTISAGVFLAAEARRFNNREAAEKLIRLVELQDEYLTSATTVLFDYLVNGETETTPEELRNQADEQEQKVSEHELKAAAFLLNSLINK